MGSDLEIEIRPGAAAGTYDVEVDSPAGTATGTMRLDAESILNRRRELAASVLASAVTSRSTFSTMEAPIREVGHSLFEALFAERIYGRYTASLQQAGNQGEPLRVVLRLRDPVLAGIPWETLFDPEAGEYLCQREPLVRYVEVAQPSAPLTATGPLRILGMVAAPHDLPSLDTAEERRRLDDALGELQDQGLVEMVWVESGSWGALQQKLMSGPWHVLHVIGHGGVKGAGGVLALEDETTGNAAMVGAARFARLLHACRPVPRLVVLNSCSSGESAADDLLSSTAAALVHSGITATVAMQFAVTDPAALAFSRGFYQAMAHNIAVDEAVRLGRIAIDGTSEQTLEWVTPVVYLRTDDTRLFALTAGEQQTPTSLPGEGEDISQEAAKYGLYVQALAAARKGRYDEAAALFDSLSTLDPDYRDTTERRDRVRRAQRIETEYAAARAAEDAGDWEGALGGYRAVLDLDPHHRDALRGHDACQLRRDVVSLSDELRIHAGAEDWTAVLAVSEELKKLDPASADPDGLATKARAALGQGEPTKQADDQTTRTLTPAMQQQSQTQQQAAPRAQVQTRAQAQPQTQPQTQAPAQAQAQAQTQPPIQSPPTQPLASARGTAGAAGRRPQGPRAAQPPPPPPQPLVDRRAQQPPPPPGWDKHKRRPNIALRWILGVTGALVAIFIALAIVGAIVGPQPGPTPPSVTCWDGSSAGAASGCPTPAGFAGLASVFPSMDSSCQQVAPSADGKIELFECVFQNFTVRYSRWTKDTNLFDFFDGHIHHAQTAPWQISGVTAGRQWVGLDDRTSEPRRFRWIGAFQDEPYDVTVKGVDEAAMREGIASVQVKTPDQIGLP